jgi:hypothetical protein
MAGRLLYGFSVITFVKHLTPHLWTLILHPV